MKCKEAAPLVLPRMIVYSAAKSPHTICLLRRLNPSLILIFIAGIQEMLERVSTEKGLKWEEFFAKLKKNEQWHVEVY